MALRGLLRDNEQSTRIEHVMEWAWKLSSDERAKVRQDLAKLTVTELHGPRRASILDVLGEHKYASALEESVDPAKEDYMFNEAKSLDGGDKKDFQDSVRRVWNQGPLEDKIRSVLPLTGPTGGNPAGGSGDVAAGVNQSALPTHFYQCTALAASLLQRQEQEDRQFQQYMQDEQSLVHLGSAQGMPSRVTRAPPMSDADVMAKLKAGKALGVQLPIIAEASVKSTGLGRQITTVLLVCEGIPFHMGPSSNWLYNSTELARFTEIFGIATRGYAGVRGALSAMQRSSWSPSTPIQLMAAAFAPQGQDSLNLAVEKKLCEQTETLHDLVDRFTDWLLIYNICQAARDLPADLKHVVIQDTNCDWVIRHALECTQPAHQTHASELINQNPNWQGSPAGCLQVLMDLKTWEQSRIAFASTDSSKTARARSTYFGLPAGRRK